MAKFLQRDTDKRETAQAKNEFESYVISMQGQLGDESLDAVTNWKQRDSFAKQLQGAEDWLFMDGADEPASVFRYRSPLPSSTHLSHRPPAPTSSQSCLKLRCIGLCSTAACIDVPRGHLPQSNSSFSPLNVLPSVIGL